MTQTDPQKAVETQKKATAIVQEMLQNDSFSQWLGIEIKEVGTDYCKLEMSIRDEMLNGMKKAQGGITFSFADSAFAFASNTRGRKSVSIEASINHIEALESGDVITAEASLESVKNKLGFYIVRVKKADTLVALFKGVVYRTGVEWAV